MTLRSGGRPSYQMIYREARGVYWNADEGAVESNALTETSEITEIAHRMIDVTSACGIQVLLHPEVKWRNLTMEQIGQIQNAFLE